MPSKALSPCRTCGVLGCETHVRPAWGKGIPTQRITGRRLQKLRSQLFAKHPLCVACQAKGRVAVATIRDHIIPLAEGGPDVESNVQALCQRCSDEKTEQEQRRGTHRRSVAHGAGGV